MVFMVYTLKIGSTNWNWAANLDFAQFFIVPHFFLLLLCFSIIQMSRMHTKRYILYAYTIFWFMTVRDVQKREERMTKKWAHIWNGNFFNHIRYLENIPIS